MNEVIAREIFTELPSNDDRLNTKKFFNDNNITLRASELAAVYLTFILQLWRRGNLRFFLTNFSKVLRDRKRLLRILHKLLELPCLVRSCWRFDFREKEIVDTDGIEKIVPVSNNDRRACQMNRY